MLLHELVAIPGQGGQIPVSFLIALKAFQFRLVDQLLKKFIEIVFRHRPEHIDPHICTHIIFAFGWMKKNKLSSFDATDETKAGKKGLYERVTDLKKQNPNLKVLLAIGEFRELVGSMTFEVSGSEVQRAISFQDALLESKI